MLNKLNLKGFSLFLKENFFIISGMFIALQLLLIFSFYVVHKSSFVFILIFGVLNLFTYIFAKDLMDEKMRKIGFFMAEISVVLFGVNLINHLVYIFIYTNIKNQTGQITFGPKINPESSLGIASLFNLAFLIAIALLSRKEEIKTFLKEFEEESVLERLGIFLDGVNGKEGDVCLCKDSKTNRPVFIPYKDRFLHMLILGPTGSGKTSQIIIPMLNQDMQNLSAGVTVIEPKGDLAEKAYAMSQYYGREAVYFNPILDGCPTFNPLFGKEEDVIENMVTTFKMLNPDSPQFFQDMTEQMFRNALKVLKRLKGNAATLIDLDRLISNAGGQGRKMVTAFAKLQAPTESLAKENADIANYFLGDYFNDKSRTYEHCSGGRSQIAKIVSNKFLRKVLNPTNGKSDVDFDEHLAKGGILCITTAQGKLRDLGRFLGYFVILNFQSSVFKRSGNENTRKPHFLYIDEFQVYSNPGFADMLTQGRSYRVASHLATQNRALIGMGSGQEGRDFIELVSTNARNIVIFPGANYNDAKYYSDQFGEIMKRKEMKGISKAKFNPLYGFQRINYPNESLRFSEELEARFTPTDIIYKEFGEITYAIIKNNTIQIPNVGKIEYIPKDLNGILDNMVEENDLLMKAGYDPNEYRDFQNHGKLQPIDMDQVKVIVEQKESGKIDTTSNAPNNQSSQDNFVEEFSDSMSDSSSRGGGDEEPITVETIEIDEWDDLI